MDNQVLSKEAALHVYTDLPLSVCRRLFHIYDKYYTDIHFRRQFLKAPRQLLFDNAGLRLKSNINIKFATQYDSPSNNNTTDTIYVSLPDTDGTKSSLQSTDQFDDRLLFAWGALMVSTLENGQARYLN